MTQQNDITRTRSTSLGWMIQRIAGQLDKDMAEELDKHGLALRHFAVMMTVLEHPGLTQTEIGRRFSMPPYAISRAIDELEAKGLLERRAHPTSRRAHTIHAAEAGKALQPALIGIVERVNARLTKALNHEERDAFAALLAKVMPPSADK